MSVPPTHPSLVEELEVRPDLPFVSLPVLFMMKLDALRPRDREDVRMLLRASPGRLREVRD